MGEYAEYALAAAMRRGTPYKAPLARSPETPCPLCSKGIRGGFVGMVDHLKAKHAMRDKAARAQALAANTRPDGEGKSHD